MIIDNTFGFRKDVKPRADNEIKRHAKDINKQQKQFDKTFEKIVKTQKKFEKQLAQLKK